MGAAGTGTSMSIYGSNINGNFNAQMAVYDNASPHNLIANAYTPSVAINGAKAWFTSNFASAPTFTAVPYWVVFNQDAQGYIYSNSGSAAHVFTSKTFGSWSASQTLAQVGGSYIFGCYCTYTAGGGSTYNLTNSPSSIDFGVIQPNTKYYAYGSAPSNPITDGQCTFTITNGQSNAIKVNIQATNFTGGGGWTLGAPDGTHARLIAYYSGQNPASGVTLTTSPQAFVASLAGSATLKWDFSFETATSFADGTQKSSSITLTGVAP
jgi:hypothetical protein